MNREKLNREIQRDAEGISMMLRAKAELSGYVQQHETPINFMAPPSTANGATRVTPLRWHVDARGALVELYRQSWRVGMPPCSGQVRDMVRQAYVSSTAPGVVKGWHLHAVQSDRFVCLRGRIMLATYDLIDKPEHVTVQVLEPMRGISMVEVPPGVAHGWRALGDEEAWVLNLCSMEYTGTDEWRRPAHGGPLDSMPFDWNMEIDG